MEAMRLCWGTSSATPMDQRNTAISMFLVIEPVPYGHVLFLSISQ